MSYLQIQMNVELTFKPIYKPLLSEILAISIFNSDFRDEITKYYFGKVSEKEIENILKMVVKGNYLVCIENKCVGDERIKGEESILQLLTKDNKNIRLKVAVA